MKKLVIDPVTRIEGHAKIDIYLDDAGHVADTQFHVTQVRGFEKFTEGRPFYEMPSITARICGICPVSHLLASAKACDAIMAVAPPPAGVKLRELIHCAQFVQSHALSFFHLSAPDLLLGFDCDPAHRNVFGLIEEQSRDGARRHRAAQVRPGDHRGAGQGARPSVVDRPRRRQRAARLRRCATASSPDCPTPAPSPSARWRSSRRVLDRFQEEIANFGTDPTMYAGLVDDNGGLQWYDGLLKFRDAERRHRRHRYPRRAIIASSSAKRRCAIPT